MARRLRVPVNWLREQAESGKIPSLHAGGEYLFDPKVVEAVIARRLRDAARKGGK